MLRRAVLAAVAALLVLPNLAAAQKPITLWHVFNLDTDVIYIGIKSFNESQNTYRIEPRLVPANQLSAELIKAIATGLVPDLAVSRSACASSSLAQASPRSSTAKPK